MHLPMGALLKKTKQKSSIHSYIPVITVAIIEYTYKPLSHNALLLFYLQENMIVLVKLLRKKSFERFKLRERKEKI